MERRLGRGLGALLSPTHAQGPDSVAPQVSGAEPAELAVDRIRPNPFQPRTHFEASALEELKQSIRRHGLLQPIVVRPTAGGDFELVSGERRLRAFQSLERRTIPAVVRGSVSDAEMLELALVENLQRRDLDPIERARGFRRMLEDLSLTQEQVAEKVGLQRSTVANHLRLLELPEVLQEALAKGVLQMGHARALLGIKDPQVAAGMLTEVVRGDLSVREVEAMVRTRLRPPTDADEQIRTVVPQAPWVRELQDRMREFLGTKVELRNGPGYKGQIVIDYYQREDLERLAALLAPRPSL